MQKEREINRYFIKERARRNGNFCNQHYLLFRLFFVQGFLTFATSRVLVYLVYGCIYCGSELTYPKTKKPQYHVERPKAPQECDDSKAHHTAVFVVWTPLRCERCGTNSDLSSEVGFWQPVAIDILEYGSACMYICTEAETIPCIPYLIAGSQ